MHFFLTQVRRDMGVTTLLNACVRRGLFTIVTPEGAAALCWSGGRDERRRLAPTFKAAAQ